MLGVPRLARAPGLMSCRRGAAAPRFLRVEVLAKTHLVVLVWLGLVASRAPCASAYWDGSGHGCEECPSTAIGCTLGHITSYYSVLSIGDCWTQTVLCYLLHREPAKIMYKPHAAGGPPHDTINVQR